MPSDPLEVHLLNATPWWQPWLPVLASTIIAAATLIVMWRSLKANRSLEREKWRQDVLMSALVRATEISNWCEEKMNARQSWATATVDEFIAEAQTVADRTTDLAAVITKLFLIHAYDAAYAARNVRGAIHSAVVYVQAYTNLANDPAQQDQKTAVLSFMRDRQNMLVAAGRRQLDGKGYKADDAQAFYETQPLIGDLVGPPMVAPQPRP